MNLSARDSYSTTTASLIGIGVGVGVLLLYVIGGLFVAQWDLTGIFTDPTPEIIGTFLVLGTLTAAVFAIPITVYLRFQIVTPIVILATILIIWSIYSAVTGILVSEDVFGVGLYAIGIAPLYFICYEVIGVVEYYMRS